MPARSTSFSDLPIRDIAPTLTKIAGAAGALERSLAPVIGPATFPYYHRVTY